MTKKYEALLKRKKQEQVQRLKKQKDEKLQKKKRVQKHKMRVKSFRQQNPHLVKQKSKKEIAKLENEEDKDLKNKDDGEEGNGMFEEEETETGDQMVIHAGQNQNKLQKGSLKNMFTKASGDAGNKENVAKSRFAKVLGKVNMMNRFQSKVRKQILQKPGLFQSFGFRSRVLNSLYSNIYVS